MTPTLRIQRSWCELDSLHQVRSSDEHDFDTLDSYNAPAQRIMQDKAWLRLIRDDVNWLWTNFAIPVHYVILPLTSVTGNS